MTWSNARAPYASAVPDAGRIQLRGADEVQLQHRLRLRQRDRVRGRRRFRPARLPVTCRAAPTAVDEQAVNGIRHGVQGRAYGRQAAEPLPLLLGAEADLKHHAPAVRMPRPVDGAIGQRGFDQCIVVLLLPQESGQLAVQDLDRPPFSHCGNGTSFPWAASGSRLRFLRRLAWRARQSREELRWWRYGGRDGRDIRSPLLREVPRYRHRQPGPVDDRPGPGASP